MRNEVPIICTAPFTSLVIGPNQTIRPCCEFIEDLGELNQQTIIEILSSNKVKSLQDQMFTSNWPSGCESCRLHEYKTGTSLRHSYMPHGSRIYSKNNLVTENFGHRYFNEWNKGITSLEISSSNICNLSCAGCNTRFSSSWNKYSKMIEKNESTKFYREAIGENPIVNPDNDLLLKNLSQLDLLYLKRVNIKGGEPMLNTDVLVALRYFNEIGIIHNLSIHIDTGGSIIIDNNIEELIQLLSKTKKVIFSISIDGPEEVNTYIRYSPKMLSSFDNICSFINIFEEFNIQFIIAPTIMVYNIFSLDRLAEWWLYEAMPKYKNVNSEIWLYNYVVNPTYLSLSALQPSTINKLIDYYKRIVIDKKYGNIFANTIDVLTTTQYGGNILHDQMVRYTNDMDKLKGQNILNSIPELENEMIYLNKVDN